ncbi:MAG: chemotaxis protein CheB [Armatimonadetes bacterium]|nr:chemotaxis protein CheB [Armatimonadota bacterium]
MPTTIILIGASLGGLEALEILLPRLPAEFPAPVVLVQHRGIEPDDLLVEVLQKRSALPVTEPEDKEPILGGKVYVAPADYHLLVDLNAKPQSRKGNTRRSLRLCVEDRECVFALNVDPPVNYARPSIDVLFESAAVACGEGVLALVLTGASRDGAAGVAKIKECGGVVVVQDPTTAQSAVMPAAAIGATSVDFVLSLTEIGDWLAREGRPDPALHAGRRGNGTVAEG